MGKIESMALWQARKSIAAMQSAPTIQEFADRAEELCEAFRILDNSGLLDSIDTSVQSEPPPEITCEWIGR